MWFCNCNTSLGYRPARRGKASGQRVTSAIVAQPRWLTVRIVWPRSRRWHSVPTAAAPRRLCQLGVPADIASQVSWMMNTSSSFLNMALWVVQSSAFVTFRSHSINIYFRRWTLEFIKHSYNVIVYRKG